MTSFYHAFRTIVCIVVQLVQRPSSLVNTIKTPGNGMYYQAYKLDIAPIPGLQFGERVSQKAANEANYCVPRWVYLLWQLAAPVLSTVFAIVW